MNRNNVSNNQSEQNNFVRIGPKLMLKGSLVTVARKSLLPKIYELGRNKKKRIYTVKGYISDHIPHFGTIQETLSYEPKRIFELEENPLTLYHRHSGFQATFFDMHADESGYLTHIDVDIEATFPINTFAPARSALNSYLDTLIQIHWVPAIIYRLDLHIRSEDIPILHRIFLPSQTSIRFSSLGGLSHFPEFRAYDALLREALTSSSPFYKFLCSFRLYEGLKHMRKRLRELSSKFGVSEALPSAPKIDNKLFSDFGLEQELFEGVHSLGKFVEKIRPARNRIAHFMSKNSYDPMDVSNGFLYYEYAILSAILLHFTEIAVNDLRIYYSKHIKDNMFKGAILPIKSKRDSFLIQA